MCDYERGNDGYLHVRRKHHSKFREYIFVKDGEEVVVKSKDRRSASKKMKATL